MANTVKGMLTITSTVTPTSAIYSSAACQKDCNRSCSLIITKTLSAMCFFESNAFYFLTASAQSSSIGGRRASNVMTMHFVENKIKHPQYFSKHYCTDCKHNIVILRIDCKTVNYILKFVNFTCIFHSQGVNV